MGAPKKKWSSEEEAALKAGIEKYGAGKWSAILNDPEYHDVLQARTNVDLKDKWRNINVMLNGVGYRQRGIGVPKHKHGKSTPKPQNKNLAATSDSPLEAKPAIVNKDVQIGAPKPVKTPKLQNKDSVATSGLPLVVVKPEDLNKDVLIDPQSSDMEIVQVDSPKAEKHGIKHEIDTELQQKMLEETVEMVKHGNYKAPVKHEINADLKRLVDMTADEAAIAAGEAVAEAEAAIELADRAVREAEVAEQEAEAARNFAEAAYRALKCLVK